MITEEKSSPLANLQYSRKWALKLMNNYEINRHFTALTTLCHIISPSHAGTVVPECFKDDNASQWKSGKFDPRSLKNALTDRHLNLHG